MPILWNIRQTDNSLYQLRFSDGLITEWSRQSGPIRRSQSIPLARAIPELRGGATVAEIDVEGEMLLPAAIDGHIHSRDPGAPAKETWETLEQAAFRGGVVGVADMPNTNPPTLRAADIAEKEARTAARQLTARFYLGVTAENFRELGQLMAQPSLAGIKVYYGPTTGGLVFSDLEALAQILWQHPNTFLSFHSEDTCAIHKAEDAERQRHADPDPEFHSRARNNQTAVSSTERILEWARRVPFRVHIAHVSTPEEATMIEEARATGSRVSGEVAPHHMLLSTDNYHRGEYSGNFLKVNPPLRSPADAQRLGEAFARGVFDMFATDHAPHTLAEKKAGYWLAPSGLPSLEFFYPLLATCARRFGLPLADAVAMATRKPAQLLGFGSLGSFAPGHLASWVWFRDETWRVAAQDIRAHCGWSPYLGFTFSGKIMATCHRGIWVQQAYE